MIGRMPAAIASSAIDMMFSTMCWVVIGPLFCARSFVPARITTACGWRLITSARKRQSIWPVTCPPMPRQAKLFAVKNSGWALSHPSVIELPMNTTAGGVVSCALASA